MKIAFPVTAMAILSMVFLVSGGTSTASRIAPETPEMQRIVIDRRVENPRFSHVTSDGTAITLAAQSARVDLTDTDLIEAFGLSGRIDLEDGVGLTLDAAEGHLNTVDRTAVMQGGVTLSSSTGYHVTTDRIESAWSEARISTNSAVIGSGPPGRFTAGGVSLRREAAGDYVLSFTDGVKLIYDPKASAE